MGEPSCSLVEEPSCGLVWEPPCSVVGEPSCCLVDIGVLNNLVDPINLANFMPHFQFLPRVRLNGI